MRQQPLIVQRLAVNFVRTRLLRVGKDSQHRIRVADIENKKHDLIRPKRALSIQHLAFSHYGPAQAKC
jgi:hypothetical protein